MALVVLGMFVLVWIISAVVKATQDPASKRGPQAQRPVRQADAPRVERTSNTDIDRFMAEIDRLRQRGEGAAAPPVPRPVNRPAAPPPLPSGEYPAAAERRPAERRPAERRPTDRKSAERRPRLVVRPTPPVPSESAPVVPVLRPLPTMTETPPAPLVSPRSVPTSSRIAREARVAGAVAPASQMAQTIRTLLRAKEGRGAALILAEVLGEPRGRQLIQRRKPQTG